MDVFDIDHYLVLGLPSGEQGFRLTKQEIRTAYKLKAKELHPDKNPGDQNADANFQKMQASYQILKNGKARKLLDDRLRAKQQKRQSELQRDSKLKRMKSDLDQRERDYAFDTTAKARSEEKEIIRKLKLKQEVDRIRKEEDDRIRKEVEASTPLKKEFVSGERSSAGGRANVKAREPVKSQGPLVNEELVLQKLRKAAERQKCFQYL